MRKNVRRMSLHRETLYRLNPNELLQAAGADNEPPFEPKEPPTNGLFTCTCVSNTCASWYRC